MPMRKPHWHFLFMELDKCFKIGWIAKPHGLKGEVTVMLEEDAPDDLAVLGSVFLEQNNRLVPYFIQSVSGHKNKAFVKFEDVETIEAAEKIAKQSIYLDKALRPKSGRGEFYDDEILGFEIHDEEKGLLGKIIDVMQAGPNRLLVLEYLSKEVLIPINAPFITNVNKTKKRISVALPEGFLDL